MFSEIPKTLLYLFFMLPYIIWHFKNKCIIKNIFSLDFFSISIARYHENIFSVKYVFISIACHLHIFICIYGTSLNFFCDVIFYIQWALYLIESIIWFIEFIKWSYMNHALFYNSFICCLAYVVWSIKAIKFPIKAPIFSISHIELQNFNCWFVYN